MKRIRFVEPQSRPGTVFSPFVRQWPLMGPVILGTLLRARGHDVVVYNENISGSVLEDPAIWADLCEADWVGISIMTPTANRGYRIADSLRRQSRRPRIALGGVHATFRPEEALQHADHVVAGEAEHVIADLVEGRIEPGIVRGRPVEDLDALPTPDIELIHDYPRLWASVYGKSLYRVPVLTSRGCPHNCQYCSVTAFFGHRYRYRSPARVLEDLHRLHDRGYRRFFFYDDNFTANRPRVRQILESVCEMKVAWNAQTRLDFHWHDPGQRTRSDRELLGLMRRSGADVVYVGYETIDDDTAKEWKKGYQGSGPLEVRSAEDTRILHDAGLWVHGMFVVGPEQDEAALNRIIDFACRNDIESIQISALTPFPGTAIYNQQKYRLLFQSFPEDWAFFDGFHCVCQDGRMGVRDFQEKLIQAHMTFYRKSACSLGRFRKFMRGPGGAWNKLRVLIHALRMPQQLMTDWHRQSGEFLLRLGTAERDGEARGWRAASAPRA